MSELENRKKGYQITIITLMIIIIALLLSLIVLFATGKAVRTVTVTPPESSSSVPVSSSSEPEPSSSSEPEPGSSSEPEPSSSSEPPPSSSVAPPPPPPAYVPPVYVPPAPVAPPPPPPIAPIEQPTVLDISQTGSYEENGVYESGIIRTSGVVLKNKTFNGDLVITKDIGKRGVVTLENVIIKGELYIYAGAEDGIRMKDCSIHGITVENADDMIGLRASGRTDIGTVTLKSDVYLDEDNLNYRYYGFSHVTVKPGVPVWYDIDVGNTRLDEMTIGSPSRVHISSDGRIKEVYANDSLKLSGYGSVATLRVKANNITYETRPGEVINPKGIYEDPSYGAK